ncbi:hypothetical protein PI87_24245 [Ralstonia sp. A12]|uniref:hypothetical protein n=1 Tax=Ralstonia sp. A12 TaxID=1217052 RepID=UPI0005747EA3|nr:hypothetical protein [Ralstonia sp. A12]KHK49865.1 hypothetical protein PI87_24245 [Ralstonia sp. A12]
MKKTAVSLLASVAALMCSGVTWSATTAATTTCDTLAQRVKTTSVAVGGSVSPSDEYTPTVIAPRADGTSVLAWTDTVTNSVRLSTLTANDVLARSLPSVDGLQVQAALTTANGGLALAVVANDPDIYSPKYCYSTSTTGNAICGKMDLVLLRANGSQVARTTLTNKSNVDSVGAQFIWWYGHSARLATDGKTIEVYYRSAMSTARPNVTGEVDIHAGDTLKFVNATSGVLMSGGWDWGCSHSWSVRAGYNGAQWAAVCHGDAYPNAMQYAHMATPAGVRDTMQWLNDTDPSQRALGGLVPVSGGFWLNYIELVNGTLSLKLAKLPNSGSVMHPLRTIAAAKSIDSTYPFRPYMAAYGTDKLLMGWKSGGKLVLAVADSTGKTVEGPVTTNLPIDTFEDMVTTSAGDVVWAHSDGGGTISVNRVAACKRPS